MRDPDLVQRAERAAAALEQAWVHWRTRHGLGPGPLPPVSSYVGYSVTEPWGQPRVVLGVEADEAERLAAILEGDDYVGPVHDDVTARIELHHPAKGGYVPPQPTGEQLDRPGEARRAAPSGPSPRVTRMPSAAARRRRRWPLQRVPPGRWQLFARPGRTRPSRLRSRPVARAGARAVSARGQRRAPDLVRAARTRARTARARTASRPEPATDALTAEQPILPLALRRAAAMADTPAELASGRGRLPAGARLTIGKPTADGARLPGRIVGVGRRRAGRGRDRRGRAAWHRRAAAEVGTAIRTAR